MKTTVPSRAPPPRFVAMGRHGAATRVSLYCVGTLGAIVTTKIGASGTWALTEARAGTGNNAAAAIGNPTPTCEQSRKRPRSSDAMRPGRRLRDHMSARNAVNTRHPEARPECVRECAIVGVGGRVRSSTASLMRCGDRARARSCFTDDIRARSVFWARVQRPRRERT